MSLYIIYFLRIGREQITRHLAAYDGDPNKLADAIRASIGTYLKSYVRQRQAVGLKGGMRQGPEGTGQNVVGYDSPFTPSPKAEPTPYYPSPSPTLSIFRRGRIRLRHCYPT